MSTPESVATIALQGAATGVSCELAVRNLFRKKDTNTKVRIAKIFLGLCMAIKSIAFLSFHANQGYHCYATGRVADLFYHFAMTAGNHILVTRVQSILPIEWKRRGVIFHTTLTVLRFFFGIIDTALVNINVNIDGTCDYADEEFWGPVYTLYDTLVDLYVTILISIILISHIKAIESDKMKVNTTLYSSVIYQNVIRTFCLMVVNLTSTIFIIINTQAPGIALLWPIINFLFIILVGYDSDVTKAIRKLQQSPWRKTNDTDLACALSISRINSKGSVSMTHSDEAQVETTTSNEPLDESLAHIERKRTHSLPTISYQSS